MPGCFFVTFLLVWLPVTLIFDGVLGYGLFQQCRAWGFAEAAGTVVSSEVVTTSDSDGDDSHHLAITYRYTVNGREFTRDRYKYAAFGTNDKSWHRIAKGLPPGTPVTVYHDPANPAEATLTRGPQGFDLILANFLVPFNLVAAALVASRLRRRRVGEEREGVTTLGRWGVFGGVWGLVALVSTFVLVFTAGFNPPLWAAAIPWAVGPGLGLAAFVAVAWAAMKADRPARPPVGSTRRGGGVP
jgi:hypothetical protein